MFEVFSIITFLLWVNCLPSLATVIIGDRLHSPLDGGRVWEDGRPIFGENKTIRGIVVSIVGGIAVCPLLGQNWWVAGGAASLAMAGDLLSSFIKRRCNFHSGKNIAIFDQSFESLFPLLFLSGFVELHINQFFLILGVFVFIAYFSSLLWLYIVDRPIPKDYPRIVKSKVRIREWRACHLPLARYQKWFNLTSFLSDQLLLTWFFKITGLYATGMKNAADIHLVEKTFSLPQLPKVFEGYRILLLTDLHLDGVEGVAEKVAALVAEQKIDICLLGGDLRMKTYGEISPCLKQIRWLVASLRPKHGFIGVLGNHDCIEMLPDLEDAGVVMLVNDSWHVERAGARIWLMGVDDPHYYRLDDAKEASSHVVTDEFSIFLAHSPESYAEAAQIHANLYLCGHTHGGQVCLMNGKPLITNSRAPRFTAVGEWEYEKMKGYTSRGVGASSIPVRFNCPPEVSLITLSRGVH